MEPVTRARVLIAAAIGGTMVWLCAGCGLFKPAVPEQAVGTVIVGDYSTPDSTLATLARAIDAKGNQGGQDAYMAGLADTTIDGHAFQALFDQATVLRYLSTNATFPVWLKDPHERNFYGKFASTNGGNGFAMRWGEGQASDDLSNDSLQILYRRYDIFLTHGPTVIDTLVTGYAEFRMIRSGSRWVMWRWIDTEAGAVGNAISYGELRLRNQ